MLNTYRHFCCLWSIQSYICTTTKVLISNFQVDNAVVFVLLYNVTNNQINGLFPIRHFSHLSTYLVSYDSPNALATAILSLQNVTRAVNPSLSSINAVVFISSGQIYICDKQNHIIHMTCINIWNKRYYTITHIHID